MKERIPRKGTMLRNMITSYSLIVLVSVLVTAVALTFGYQRREINQLNRHMVSLLKQASHTTSLVIEQGNIIGNQALNDWLIVNTMNASKQDPLTEYIGLLKLREYKNSNILFDHLGIYCWKTGRYVCDGMYNDSFADRYEALLDANPGERVFTIQEHIEFAEEAPRNLITVAYRSRYGMANRGCVTVSFDHRTLVNLARTETEGGDDKLFIIDSTGNVISHPDDSMFMTSLAGERFARRILDSGELSGNFVDEVFGESCLVCYTRGEYSDWIFVSTHPYSALNAGFAYMLGLMSLVALIVGAVAVALTLQQSRNIYSPLGTLVEQMGGYEAGEEHGSDIVYLRQMFEQVMDRTNRLQYTLSSAQNMISDSLYTLLLSGRINDIPGGAEQMLEELETWQGRFFAVALIQLDTDGLSEQDCRQQWEKFMPLMERAGEKLQPECTRCKALYMDGYIGALLIQFDGEMPVQRLDELYAEYRSSVSIGLRMSVGGSVKGMEDLSVSYRQAQIALKYSYLYGTGGLLVYTDIEGQLSGAKAFPIDLEKEVLEQIRQRREEEAATAIDAFVQYIAVLPAEQAMQFMDQLRLSIYKAFYEFLSLRSQAALVYVPGTDFRVLEEEKQALVHICGHIIADMGDKQLRRSQPVVDQLYEIIRQEYANPDLTIDVLGQRLGLSANYISRIFKAITGDSLHSSLTSIRMERARELLSTTDHSVSRISEMVGIENGNYFYTLFKRAFGLTPTEYRNSLPKE